MSASGLLARLRGAAAPRPEAAARHESFLVYRGGYYFKLAVLLCALSILVYALHDPVGGPSGGSWLGYTLGSIGALLIVWLAWFGVRKRSFVSARAPAQAWVSAHVYLGLSLIVVATLHSGFQLDWNVHGLAYVLMLAVIISGLYGIWAYATLPARITATREGLEFRAMLEQITEHNNKALALAEKIDSETHAVIARSVAKVRIGGSAWEQLSGRYREAAAAGEQGGGLDQFLNLKRSQLAAGAAAPAAGAPAEGKPARKRQVTIAFVADQIFSARSDKADGSGETLQKLLREIGDRKRLIERVNRDITLRARLQVWLYLHVPLSVALLAALLIHIFAVFFYW